MASATLRDLITKRDEAFDAFDYVATVYRTAEGTPPEDWTAEYDTRKAAVEELDLRIIDLNAEETRTEQINSARARAGIVPVGESVIREEPHTYGPGSDNSFYLDLARSAMPGTPGYSAAVERLNAHGREVVRDAVNDPKERERVIRAFREGLRSENQQVARTAVTSLRARDLEIRAGMDTSSGSGGSFVTPEYLVPQYAPYMQFGRVFADQANKQDLPDYGMTVYLPQVTSPAGVASQTQLDGVDEADPTAGYLSANLVTEAGQVTVSQQLLDRAGPGVQFDKIVFDQLQRAYNQQFDTAVLIAALANAGTVSDNTSGTSGADIIGCFYSDVANAAQKIGTTASQQGLWPTHVFTTPTEWSFLAAQQDSNGRPLIVPSYAGAFNAIAATIAGKETPNVEGNTGFDVQSLDVWRDGNIPQSGSDTQILVAHMPEVWVWEGELVPRAIPQTYAQNLAILLQVYSYNAVIVRYPKAVYAITGSRYPAAPSFPQPAS